MKGPVLGSAGDERARERQTKWSCAREHLIAVLVRSRKKISGLGNDWSGVPRGREGGWDSQADGDSEGTRVGVGEDLGKGCGGTDSAYIDRKDSTSRF
jgi:hypothetical protein